RRVPLHATRRRRGLRRLRHLQVGQPVATCTRDRRGDDALPRRRRARARLGWARRGDGRHLHAVARPGAAARVARLVTNYLFTARNTSTCAFFGARPPASGDCCTTTPTFPLVGNLT